MMRGEREEGGGSGGEETLGHDYSSQRMSFLRCSNAEPPAAVPTISSVTIFTSVPQPRTQPSKTKEARTLHPNPPLIPENLFCLH